MTSAENANLTVVFGANASYTVCHGPAGMAA